MFPEKDRLEKLCQEGMERLGLNDERYKARLASEMHEIDAQVEYDYLLDLYDKQARFSVNENNLLVAYLLGLTDQFDIDEEPHFAQGELPDIDIDYMSEIQDYLKNKWAPSAFGEDCVCSIGTYGTLGIKQALKDMTRVHGIPRDEIEVITKGIPPKDDDGKPLQWEKALEICPDLKNYCERYPEITDSVKMLLNRRKSAGVHAGGLIISSVPIADFVPLEVRSVNKDNKYGVVASAWGEGLHSQDLGAVGLVKIDVLVVDGLRQIAVACQLIKERYGIDHICALPGKRNWSDTSYLNDPKALDLVARGDTKCIFQFGSEGIRKMVKKGGVTSFDDVAAYSALYRPGPMNCLPKDTYIKTDQGTKDISSLDNTKDSIQYLAVDGSIKSTRNYLIHSTGKKKLRKITTKSGKVIVTSLDHRFLSEGNQYVKSKDLSPGEKIAILK
jgi:DNA polymerase-3 subunit alpha